jgi:hypothetical protein
MADSNDLLRQLAAEREARRSADEGGSVGSAQVGRPEERNRKKKTPVRRPQEREEQEEEPVHAPARKSAKRRSAGAAATKPSKKRGPAAPTSLEFDADGDDAADVAGAFMRNDFGEGRDSLGTVAFDQFASAARIHALENGQVGARSFSSESSASQA